MTVADRIKNARIEKGYTQSQLAKLIGVKDKSTISKIEAAGNEVSLKDIKRIADALGLSAKYFLGWDDSTVFEVVNEDSSWKSEKDDVSYVILTNEEQLLIDSYRDSDEETRKMIRRLLAYNSLCEKELKK